MLKLIKLEIKKFKLGGYVKGVIIANLIMLSVLILCEITAKEEMFGNFNDVFLYSNIFVRATFTIFGAVLISKLIIGEYKNKTINILFTYPTSRKKIMVAKLAFVVIFTFTTMIISNIFLNSSAFVVNIFTNLIKVPLTEDVLLKNLINFSLNSVAFSFVSLIPLFVGMKKKSEVATIVTSVILVSLLSNVSSVNSEVISIIIPICLAIIGAGIAYLSIKRVGTVDV